MKHYTLKIHHKICFILGIFCSLHTVGGNGGSMWGRGGEARTKRGQKKSREKQEAEGNETQRTNGPYFLLISVFL